MELQQVRDRQHGLELGLPGVPCRSHACACSHQFVEAEPAEDNPATELGWTTCIDGRGSQSRADEKVFVVQE